MKKINGYISNFEEAVLAMHASRLGILEPTTERLNAEEREKIESGSIFCFVEGLGGMKRWTDGRIWSPSKICGEFLIYQEVPRHMSKNSIKKRKEVERAFESIQPVLAQEKQPDETIDKTTMHKKTVCIKHESANYHIIAYYRPIFANSSLVDVPYFQKLAAALETYLPLKDDAFLKEAMVAGDEFYRKYGLDKDLREPVLLPAKRDMLEKIALEVLMTLGKSSQRRGRIIFQKERDKIK